MYLNLFIKLSSKPYYVALGCLCLYDRNHIMFASLRTVLNICFNIFSIKILLLIDTIRQAFICLSRLSIQSKTENLKLRFFERTTTIRAKTDIIKVLVIGIRITDGLSGRILLYILFAISRCLSICGAQDPSCEVIIISVSSLQH